MKKILLAIFALALTVPVFGQSQTNKMNNTALILATNSSFTYLKGPIVAGYQLTTDANGVASWAAASPGSGDVFLASNNTYAVNSINTFRTNTYFYQPGASVRVGINTNVPLAILDVHSGGDTNAFLLRLVGGPNRNNSYFDITNTANGDIFNIDKFGIATFGSNIVVNGGITQVPVNFTNLLNGLLLATNFSQTHKVGGISILGNSISTTSGGQLNLGAATSSSILLGPAANGNVFIRTTGTGILLVEGIGATVTNTLTVSNQLFVGQNGSNLYVNTSGASVIATASGSMTFRRDGQPLTFPAFYWGTSDNRIGFHTNDPQASVDIEAVGNSANVLTVLNGALLVKTNSTVTIGTNGSAIVFIKTATASLDFPSILAAGSADLTITVGGCNTNDIVDMGRPFDEDASLVTRGFVSAAGTVTVRANNVGSLAVDQAAKTYRVDVTQH